jgi:hypothetical protein
VNAYRIKLQQGQAQAGLPSVLAMTFTFVPGSLGVEKARSIASLTMYQYEV